ncbi:hypothetical protein [Microcystis phage Mvi-JY20]|uniref:Uncharacterized protein n=1 Tax=Microcystis phage Mvi-JY20 TaxID=3128146 RepID=A0AAX4QH54_9CAUD
MATYKPITHNDITIGQTVRELVSGFQGVVTGLGQYATGVWTVQVQQAGDPTAPDKFFWFEEAALVRVESDTTYPFANVEFHEPEFAFHDKVRHDGTGISGTVYGRFYYVHGCTRFQVKCTHLDKNGQPVHTTFNANELVKVEGATTPLPSKPRGGPEVPGSPH